MHQNSHDQGRKHDDGKKSVKHEHKPAIESKRVIRLKI